MKRSEGDSIQSALTKRADEAVEALAASQVSPPFFSLNPFLAPLQYLIYSFIYLFIYIVCVLVFLSFVYLHFTHHLFLLIINFFICLFCLFGCFIILRQIAPYYFCCARPVFVFPIYFKYIFDMQIINVYLHFRAIFGSCASQPRGSCSRRSRYFEGIS
jgi:hypothetical protein